MHAYILYNIYHSEIVLIAHLYSILVPTTYFYFSLHYSTCCWHNSFPHRDQHSFIYCNFILEVINRQNLAYTMVSLINAFELNAEVSMVSRFPMIPPEKSKGNAAVKNKSFCLL